MCKTTRKYFLFIKASHVKPGLLATWPTVFFDSFEMGNIVNRFDFGWQISNLYIFVANAFKRFISLLRLGKKVLILMLITILMVILMVMIIITILMIIITISILMTISTNQPLSTCNIQTSGS